MPMHPLHRRLIQLTGAVDMGEPVVLAWADEGEVLVLEPRLEPVDERVQVQAVLYGIAPRHAASDMKDVGWQELIRISSCRWGFRVIHSL